ncbi:hypothetical protein BD414DRAFT_492693 [Trametes punicea]|nr:hypothetical protein BD414DRAFT_492693 [Trametes punicea]
MPAPLSDTTGSQRSRERNPSSLEADIALLSTLLSQDTDESDPDVVELLRRLDAAQGIADGVEDRLDGIISHLDELLSDLEARTSPNQGENGTTSTAVVTQVKKVEEGIVESDPRNDVLEYDGK